MMNIIDKGKSCGIVYHYTSLAAALSIICNDGLKFHASRFDYMEDPFDSGYGFAVAQDVLEKHGIDFIDMEDHNCRPYVLSFCKKNDDFSMRRLYNAQVVLHIDSDMLLQEAVKKSNKIKGNDVLYLNDSQTTAFVTNAYSHAFHLVGIHEDLDFEAKAKCSFLKHPDYAVEKEWRLSFFEDFDLTNGCQRESLLADSNDFVSEVKFKVTNGVTRIYRELSFDSKCLKGITIFQHDMSDIMKTRDTLEIWLAKCGYAPDVVPVTITKTPKINK